MAGTEANTDPSQSGRPYLLSRRRLLRLGLGALGALAIAGGATRWIPWGRLKDEYLRIAYPPLDSGLPGRLDPASLATLEAVTEVLIGGPPAARYGRYFVWHATHVDGYRSIYTAFCAYMEAQVRSSGDPSFVECSPGRQQEILSAIMRRRAHHVIGSDLYRFWNGVVHRRLVLFDRYILQEILNLYFKTDAWLAVGYEAYPGVPTGLEAYRLPPATG